MRAPSPGVLRPARTESKSRPGSAAASVALSGGTPAGSPRPWEEDSGPQQSWNPPPLVREERPAGPEAFSVFSPKEVLSGRLSARLRRLEPDVVELRLDDIYGSMAPPWQLDRQDINGPHGTSWASSLEPDFWVSTDTGKLCFAPAQDAQAGQYHKADISWQCFTDASEAPGNAGGVHGCCIDTQLPNSQWTLVAKLADFGLALGRDAGVRVEFAALVRNDCDALIASMGVHDECRSLFMVEQIELPSGRVLIVDPAELNTAAVGSTGFQADGPAVPSGLGAGYFPVIVSRDESQRCCRITVVFHPTRAAKVCRSFPPVLPSVEAPAAASSSAAASTATPRPPSTSATVRSRPSSGASGAAASGRSSSTLA
eukprot:TRINITY_DN122678_c0_g1_i1.p1 TRINITY_DN122678_c0_g1~~TRINITY_DN122678_c0_g1_i1.p1  ORF type:complete len:371 (+),score=64.53 TRINITY_DN122678_c0_g1_i1:105-1217(+)